MNSCNRYIQNTDLFTSTSDNIGYFTRLVMNAFDILLGLSDFILYALLDTLLSMINSCKMFYKSIYISLKISVTK